MEYITAREAAAKWGITVRQVQTLCNAGKVQGALRFNRSWALPKDVQKPADRRSKALGAKECSLRTVETANRDEWLLSRFMTFFPYPIQVYLPDGILIMINDAWQKTFAISDAAAAKMIGKYNILKDPLMEKWGTRDYVLQLFQGEIAQGKDMHAPLQDISDEFGDGDRITTKIYHDIISFPIFDDHHKMIYAVIIFITSRLYSGKEEITKGKEYIENYWNDKFDLEAAAKASGLSKGHFAKLFTTHHGITPHGYYLDIKMKKLKEKLLDSNISVSRAFEECGMEYNSHYVGIFKQQTGMTPMEYRKKG